MNAYLMKPEHLWPEPRMNGFVHQAPQEAVKPQQPSLSRSCCDKDHQAPVSYHGHPGQADVGNDLCSQDMMSFYQAHGAMNDTSETSDLQSSTHMQDFTPPPDRIAVHSGSACLHNVFSPYPQQPFEEHDLNHPEMLSHDAYYSNVGSAVPSAKSSVIQYALPDPSMACMCGPGCQCVACASHPYNAATQLRVEELTDIMNGNGDFTPAQASQRQTLDGNQYWNGPDPQSVSEVLEAHDTSSPTTPQELDTIGVGGYHSLQYNIGGNCATGVCRCGEGCQCRGCMTHQGHNGS